MPDALDMDLVRDFARDHSEAAFTELVRRHIALVYSVARRFTGNPGDAEDVTQAVFIILARKAAGLRARVVLTGWLYETTRFTATRLLRANARRHAREQEACMQSTLLNETAASRRSETEADAVWEKLEPHLEAAMSKLAERDRTLLVLRFYENKSGPETAALLGIREAAARKRAERALEKLRKFFSQRRIDSTAATIAETISANSIQAAPVALAKSVTAVALAKGATASISTLTLIKGALKIMAWTKAKTAIVVGAGLLLATGVTTITIGEFHEHLHPVRVAEMAEFATPPQYGLQVGPSLLGWSVHVNSTSERTGYFYMRDVDPNGGNKPLWEFALTAKRRLSEVTRDDLRCEFYGMNDPRGPEVFGTAWDGSTIIVPEGQIFFARLVTNRSVIYAIRMAKQGTNKSGHATMQIEYREFAGQPF